MARKCLALVSIGSLWALAWLLPGTADAAEHCPQPVGQIVSAQGMVELKEARTDVWRPVGLNTVICPGDSIRVGARSRGAIRLFDTDTNLRIDQNTELQVLEPTQEGRSLIDLLIGAIHFLSRVPRALDVRTPFVNAAVEGTEFLIRVLKDRVFLTVFEGRVAATNEQGSLSLISDQSAVALAGAAPQLRIVVRPRDAVRWALHYQPVIAALADPSGVDIERDVPPALRESLRSLSRGRLTEAFDQLDRVPEPERDETFYVYRAGLLLAVGRVDEALSDLDRAAESGEAFALRAVIAVARNDKAQALIDGREAVARSPRSSAAKIALSYALQANFELEAARDALLQAVEEQPKDGLAWARLAELWLSLGYLEKALEAAERAASLAPNLGRTNTVLGFAALAQIKTSEAKAAFEKAITLESENPLPRLGLGLAKIREGALREGRGEIEIAASLDPDNALVRSYLGKAYFEERRSPLDADQLALAKKLDPNDPTPWLYDAIRKQTENRPVEALRDLQKSIEFNDNRAVYRSRLLLDEDLAIRGAALARIYDELDFDQRAIVESTKSLTINPTDHSAHRFLADSYAELPRHEIARASEQLQAQLLQPINIDPVQPQLSQTDLNIIAGAGPADITLNEFTPVFQSDGVRLDLSGFAGTQGTLGDEVVLSGIFDRVSFSLGQFHFESDGFRTNNDVEHDIFVAFVQVAVTADFDAQFEYRRRRTEQGDLRLNFDPDDFSPFERRDIDEDIYRVGLHYEPDPRSDVIASFIYGDGRERIDNIFGPGILSSDGSDSSYDGQARYIFDSERVNFTAGLAISDIDTDLEICLFPLLPSCVIDFFPDVSVQQHNAYTYADVELFDDFVVTGGVSYDGFEQGVLEVERFNPKAGVQWDIDDNFRLRLAYFRTVKRALITDQTLEPTHVAGFNQFFDDVDGTRTERYGAALDVILAKNLYGGVEFSRRKLEVPTFVGLSGSSVSVEDQRERIYRGYVYWAPGTRWALTFEGQYQDFERDDVAGFPLPTSVETLSFPASVSYFHPSGFYGTIGATYVWQEVGLPPGSIFPRDDDSFVLVDAALGYRFPNRRGLFEIEARNILDERFLFQDPNIQDQEPSNPVYIPELSILARLTLTF